jgi:hypothetical protein
MLPFNHAFMPPVEPIESLAVCDTGEKTYALAYTTDCEDSVVSWKY